MIYNNLHFDIRKNIKKISLIIVLFFTLVNIWFYTIEYKYNEVFETDETFALISTGEWSYSRDLNISKAA